MQSDKYKGEGAFKEDFDDVKSVIEDFWRTRGMTMTIDELDKGHGVIYYAHFRSDEGVSRFADCEGLAPPDSTIDSLRITVWVRPYEDQGTVVRVSRIDVLVRDGLMETWTRCSSTGVLEQKIFAYLKDRLLPLDKRNPWKIAGVEIRPA